MLFFNLFSLQFSALCPKTLESGCPPGSHPGLQRLLRCAYQPTVSNGQPTALFFCNNTSKFLLKIPTQLDFGLCCCMFGAQLGPSWTGILPNPPPPRTSQHLVPTKGLDLPEVYKGISLKKPLMGRGHISREFQPQLSIG